MDQVARIMEGLLIVDCFLFHLKDQTGFLSTLCTYLANARSILELTFQSFQSSVIVFQISTLRITAAAAWGSLGASLRFTD